MEPKAHSCMCLSSCRQGRVCPHLTTQSLTAQPVRLMASHAAAVAVRLTGDFFEAGLTRCVYVIMLLFSPVGITLPQDSGAGALH